MSRPEIESVEKIIEWHNNFRRILLKELTDLNGIWKNLYETIKVRDNLLDSNGLKFINKEHEYNGNMFKCLSKIAAESENRAVSTHRLIDYMVPPTMEHFEKKYSTRLNSLPQIINHGSEIEKCVSCQKKPADVMIVRECVNVRLPKNRICKGHECNHSPKFCKDCLVNHYWVNSKKEYQRKATCPICNSDFCMRDIVSVVKVPVPGKVILNKSKSRLVPY